MGRIYLLLGGLFAASGVLLGAGAAHVLKAELSPEKLAYFQTGVIYQQVHAIGLMVVGLSLRQSSEFHKLLWWSGAFMAFGICAFCGSLYVFAVLDVKYITRLTPVGGTALIASWILFTLGVWRGRP